MRRIPAFYWWVMAFLVGCCVSVLFHAALKIGEALVHMTEAL